MEFVADQFERLDVFLARNLPQHSRTKLSKFITDGGVRVNGKVEKPSFKLEPGMTITMRQPPEPPPHDLTPADIPLDIRYEDEHLLVVNKPRGLATHPASSLKEPSLVNALLARSHPLSKTAGTFRPGIVHRLDKETTGLLVVAKNDSAHSSLARQIERKDAERRYFAIVEGEPEHPVVTINARLARDPRDRLKMSVQEKGRIAVTHAKRLSESQYGTLVAVRLETGRTHQIRAHLSAIGHPVVGDALYGSKQPDLPMQLHAAYLRFTHPVSGEVLEVYAEPPDDFGAEVEREWVADW